ncbi:hypothetical protein [Halohasta litorea]|uniref:Uncharacterized protein n=1 Tax=Halohasta litorea TaxID=869891 RepID=A0ABD6DE41_9EURY|nr:hypothetical protein [Halohasta litorea]
MAGLYSAGHGEGKEIGEHDVQEGENEREEPTCPHAEGDKRKCWLTRMGHPWDAREACDREGTEPGNTEDRILY